MIEDRKMGVKIAEDGVEAKWERTRERMEQAIEDAKIDIEISKEILKLAKRKLKEYEK